MNLWARIIDAIFANTKSPSITITKTLGSGYKNMRDIVTLIDVICEAYDRPDLQPKDGNTYCNLAVDMIAQAMGCKELELKTADEICDYIANHLDWQEIKLNQAQDMANKGSLVIAGLDSRALNDAHGHVCVIRPGKQVYSGKWGLTPRCINVGKEMFLARAKKGPLTAMSCGLNEAFQPLPKLYVWRPSL